MGIAIRARCRQVCPMDAQYTSQGFMMTRCSVAIDSIQKASCTSWMIWAYLFSSILTFGHMASAELEAQMYVNSAAGFAITPPMGWEADESGQARSAVIFFDPKRTYEGEDLFDASLRTFTIFDAS